MQDNMTAQGVMMHRLENNLDRLEAIVIHNSESIARNTEAITALADLAKSHEQKAQLMQSAMTALFERMDRFIRGLETNGHDGGANA